VSAPKRRGGKGFEGNRVVRVGEKPHTPEGMGAWRTKIICPLQDQSHSQTPGKGETKKNVGHANEEINHKNPKKQVNLCGGKGGKTG